MKKKIIFLLAAMLVVMTTFANQPLAKAHKAAAPVHKVTLDAEEGIVPLSVAEAIEMGNELEDNASTEEEYFITGFVVSAKEPNIKFASQTFYIADDVENSAQQTVQGYNCFVQRYLSLEKKVVVGDQVFIHGHIKKFVSGTGDSKKTVIEVEGGTAGFVDEKYDEDNDVEPLQIISASQAVEYGQKLALGDTTAATYLIAGYVTSIAGKETDYDNFGNQTYWIADEPGQAASNADGAFYVFRGKGDRKVEVGDRVVARTRIFRYTRDNVIESAGVNLPVHVSNPISLDATDSWYDYFQGEEPPYWLIDGNNDELGVQLQIPYELEDFPYGDWTLSVGENIFTATYDPATGYISAWMYAATAKISKSDDGADVEATLLDYAGYLYNVSIALEISEDPEPSEPEQDVLVVALFPKNAPDQIAITGTFNEWADHVFDYIDGADYGLAGLGIHAAYLKAESDNCFKIKEAKNWKNEIEYLDPTNKEWRVIKDNEWLFGDMWGDPKDLPSPYSLAIPVAKLIYPGITDDTKYLFLDLSDNDTYRWSQPDKPLGEYPTPEYLKEQGYDLDNNVVLCFQPGEGAPVCNDMYFVGSFNNWGRNIEDEPGSEAWENCILFEELEDFPGWYVASAPFIDNFQGKPLHKSQDGDWTWDIQCGDVDAWEYVSGTQFNAYAGFEEECDIAFYAPGAYIYRMGYWKKHYDPCKPIEKKNYTIYFYAPDACPDITPAIIGPFSKWIETLPMEKTTDNNQKPVYTITLEDIEVGTEYKFLAHQEKAEIIDWDAQILYYDYMNGYWAAYRNFAFGEEETVIWDFSDNDMYRFGNCQQEEQTVVRIDCGSNFYWGHISEGNQWYIQAWDNAYYDVKLTVYGSSLSLAGIFSSEKGDFNLQQTYLVYNTGNGEETIAVTQADATITMSQETIKALVYLLGEDEKMYIVTMEMPIPTAQEFETILSTNLWVDPASDGYLFGIEYGSNQSVSIFLSANPEENPSGTYQVGENLEISINGNRIFSGEITLEVVEPKDEADEPKLKITGEVLGYNGTLYTLILTNYANPLGYSHVRVLIPSDCNMNVENGAWIWWWSNSNYEGSLVRMYQEEDTRWFKSDDFYVEDPSFDFLVVNKEVAIWDEGSFTWQYDWENAQQTNDWNRVIENESCYEIGYNAEFDDEDILPARARWFMWAVDCEAENHDYRLSITDHTFEEPGRVTFHTQAQDYTDYYELYYRLKGSLADYDNLGWCTLSEDEPNVIFPFPFTEETAVEYYFKPMNRYNEQVAPRCYGEVTVPANINLPTDLHAEVAEDGYTVTFTWTPGTSEAVANTYLYIIEIGEEGEPVVRNTLYNPESPVTLPLYVSGLYTWEMVVYDEEETWIGNIYGNEFSIDAPNYTPFNLEVDVRKQTAFLSWDTDKEITLCYYCIRPVGATNYDWMPAYGNNGKYAARFSPKADEYGRYEWIVAAAEEGNDYFISNLAFGEEFEILAPATPTEQYELIVDIDSEFNHGQLAQDYSGMYTKGAVVEILARPYYGYSFWKWNDNGTDNPRTVAILSNMHFTAYFYDPNQTFQLNLGINGEGTITGAPEELPTIGTEITLTAIPNDGWEFAYWLVNGEEVHTNPLTFTVEEDMEINAVFTEKGDTPEPPQPGDKATFNLEIKGKGTVTGTEPGEYDKGTPITLTATPETGWYFDHWTVNGEEKPDNRISFDLNENTHVIAYFKTDQKFKVTIKNGDNGSVEPAYKDREFAGGSELTIKAIPDDGYKFVNWKEDGITLAERTIDIWQDTVLTATFAELETFTLKVLVEPEGFGLVYFDGKDAPEKADGSFAKDFLEGKTVKLSVESASKNYIFSHYEEDGQEKVTTVEYDVLMDKSRTIKAVFVKKSQDVESVQTSAFSSQKVLINGQIYILRGEKLYTIQGQLVK